MTKGFRIDVATSKMEFVNGSRTVQTTAGKLITLLPTEYSFTAQTLTFPDFSKDELYVWTTSNRLQPLSSPEKYQHGESCCSFITATPQEYASAATLMTAPAGVDFFIGWAKLSRTTAPLNTWMTRTLAVLPVENQWMPISGAMSALMEAELGMARAMHIYINGSGNLVLEAEQSVGPATGGYTGNTNGVRGFSRSDGLNYNDGGNALYVTTQGIPIFKRDSKSYGYTAPAGGFISASFNTYERGGSSPCARSDTTDYTSIYSVDIKGRFGRRS
jgi:hypothetical protein